MDDKLKLIKLLTEYNNIADLALQHCGNTKAITYYVTQLQKMREDIHSLQKELDLNSLRKAGL